MKCVLSTTDLDPESLVAKAKASPGLVGRDLASEVSVGARYTWPGPHAALERFSTIATTGRKAWDGWIGPADDAPKRFRVAVLDCGIKLNQLRLLSRLGCARGVPRTRRRRRKSSRPGPTACSSNGPGDPEGVPQTVANLQDRRLRRADLRHLLSRHQLLGLAFGGRTYKLKSGHRGANQPVMDFTTGKVEITSQNHGFAVDISPPAGGRETHINLNDKTSEGMRHKTLPVFSVQYHPEAALVAARFDIPLPAVHPLDGGEVGEAAVEGPVVRRDASKGSPWQTSQRTVGRGDARRRGCRRSRRWSPSSPLGRPSGGSATRSAFTLYFAPIALGAGTRPGMGGGLLGGRRRGVGRGRRAVRPCVHVGPPRRLEQRRSAWPVPRHRLVGVHDAEGPRHGTERGRRPATVDVRSQGPESFLPICAQCKKIRNQKGEWQVLESYIGEHANTQFSHGYCPECLQEAMREAGLTDHHSAPTPPGRRQPRYGVDGSAGGLSAEPRRQRGPPLAALAFPC